MNKPELLSPVGDFECLKSAVQNGANSVYLGASSFNARARATNFGNEELLEAIKYAKLRNVSVHLTLNTLIKNDEFENAVNLAVNAYNLGVDAIIVQDLGLATYLLENYPEIPLHASTQMTVHNLDGVKQLENFGFSRVVLSRELSLNEIKHIRENTSTELEVFIHGALCISYSGQCLLSSTIGGRSGNRGLCAQPCRLPYELIENEKILDKGYLMSPRDNCALEFLPELIKLGIDSFKIEGRMKTPYYVGVVTKIYRKYIDLVLQNIHLDNITLKNMIQNKLNEKNFDTGLTDKEELTQVFNRGGFSTGHFKPSPNKDLVFKEKPNNMGFYIGTISHINENKGHLKIKLENTLSIGDKISINNESYTISELMIDNKNFETLEKGITAKIGRMKGKISVGSKVYRIETAKLNKLISPTFKEDKNFRKVKLNGEIILKKNTPISFKIWSNEGFYSGLEYSITSTIVPELALNKPISKEKIIEQLSKTGSTEFEFKNLNVILDDGLFIPKISLLNDLRRNALEGLEKLVIKKHTHNIKNVQIDTTSLLKNSSLNCNKSISLLLNIIDKNIDYSSLKNIDKLYIPLKFFINENSQISNLCNIFPVFVYMPHVLKDSINIDFEKLVNNFNIKGFVISHISQIEKVSKFNLELIGNFNLNIYNNFSINKLHTLNLSTITISPELDKFDTNTLQKLSSTKSEIIVYGKLPVMTNNYCYLGKTNKCYKECDKKCLTNNKYYLKDRMSFNFRIIPDNLQTITTIYNSKILSVKPSEFNSSSIRIDILDEDFNQIQNIINTIKSDNRFEGKEYTNGNY
jgi:putative protease